MEKPVDYQYLEQMIAGAVTRIEREEYHLESIKRSRTAIADNFFYNLTHSFPGDAQYYLKDYFPYLGINLHGGYYVSIVIDIEISDSIRQTYGLEKYVVCQMSLKDDVTAVFGGCALFQILMKHNRLILILGMDSDSKAEEERLIRLLCKKDMAGILSYTRQLSELFSDLTDKRRVFVIVYSISNRILKFLYDIDLNDEELQQQVISIYQNMDRYNSRDDICERLYQICGEICSQLKQSVDSYYQQICQSVLEFIKQNYANPELGLNELALYINISNAHLSSIFKSVTGLSASDASTRMEAAKLLLRNTRLSIEEISERVGFTNQYYFSACFKKKSEMTPSTYRDLPE